MAAASKSADMDLMEQSAHVGTGTNWLQTAGDAMVCTVT